MEIYSLPYSTINVWSTRNAGTFDISSEVELWTRVGHVKIKVGSQVDVRKIDRLISAYVLMSYWHNEGQKMVSIGLLRQLSMVSAERYSRFLYTVLVWMSIFFEVAVSATSKSRHGQ